MLSATPVSAPTSSVSHLRSSSSSQSEALGVSPQATRPVASQQELDPPSQESSVSGWSATNSSGTRLLNGSRNNSQATSFSNSTSPSTLVSAKTAASLQDQSPSKLSLATYRNDMARDSDSDDFAMTSPTVLASPIPTGTGTKRTASGHVKNAMSTSSITGMVDRQRRRSRAESFSSSGSRAGELAASLKTRLGYAMVKVQHGWEHKNIAEVEQLAVQMSPHRRSVSHLDSTSRAWMNDVKRDTPFHGASPPTISDGNPSPPAKRHSVNLASLHLHGSISNGVSPYLQPPADIDTTSRQHQTHAPTSSQVSNPSNVMSPPRTPVNGASRRPPTLRTETQTAEAERDALQALFQLGSPHNSQRSQRAASLSQAGSSQASPGRSDFNATPRHVTFARGDSNASVSSESSTGLPERRERLMAEA